MAIVLLERGPRPKSKFLVQPLRLDFESTYTLSLHEDQCRSNVVLTDMESHMVPPPLGTYTLYNEKFVHALALKEPGEEKKGGF